MAGKGKRKDKRPTRVKYTSSKRWEANKVQRVLKALKASVRKVLKGPRVVVDNTVPRHAVWRRTGVDMTTEPRVTRKIKPRKLDEQSKRWLEQRLGVRDALTLLGRRGQ